MLGQAAVGTTPFTFNSNRPNYPSKPLIEENDHR